MNSELMKDAENQKIDKFKYLTKISRILLFYFVGLSIFFITGFLIVSMRVSGKSKVTVPDVVGRLYLDEHNRLQDMGFKVEIERKFSVEYPYGYILSQNQSPGSIVKEGARLILLINQSQTVVKTPDLTGKNEGVAEKMLANIPVGHRTFSLVKGVITRIESDVPAGEIISQFPPAGTPRIPGFPVDLLISDGKNVKSTAYLQKNPESLHVEIVKQIAYEMKIPLQIEAKNVTQEKLHGYVLENNFTKTLWKVKIGRFDESEKEKEPYRLTWMNSDDLDVKNGKYTMIMTRQKILTENPYADNTEETDEVLVSKSFLQLDNDSIPLFVAPRTTIKIYEGHYMPVSEDADETDASLPANAHSLLDKEEKPQTAHKTDVQPVRVITL